MRYALIAVVLIAPLCVRADDRKLDTRKRAQSASLTWGHPATETQFREMQRHFSLRDFDTWSKKLAQLHPGMSYKQVLRELQAKEVAARTESTQTYVDVVRLDDAYVTL